MNKVKPCKKGDLLKLGVISIGSNGDLMFDCNGFKLFLKNYKDKSIKLNQMIRVKVVKMFDKLGYVELYTDNN